MRAILAAFVPLLSFPLPAQTPQNLLGLGALAVGPLGVPLLRQDPTTCAITRCHTVLNSPLDQRAGGTAYDATRSGVWVTNGLQLACVEPGACRALCAPHTPPGVDASAQLSGLACDEARGLLYGTTTANTLIVWRLECPITNVVQRCSLANVIPPGWFVGGIAVDDVTGTLFYSASTFTGPATGSTVFVAPSSAPCVPQCKFELRACGTSALGPLTGVAFDLCTSTIWVTDGRSQAAARYSPATCTAQVLRCCPGVTTGDRWTGLCLQPSGAVAQGRNCTNHGCGTCATLQHVTVGDPTIGNPAFALAVEGAPVGSQGWLFLGAGPTMPPGILVPPFCGALLVPLTPSPWILGPYSIPGSGTCTGARQVAMPVPPLPVLCGIYLSSQWLGLCTSGPFGTFVTNVLNWRVGAS
jgi:hypothetical protein